MFEDVAPWILCVGIFGARVLDVALGTFRTILVFRGRPYLAATLGFLEVTVWLLAAGQVLQNLDRWYLAACYAGGFATGNIVGIWLEGKLALGSELVRTISRNQEVDLADELRSAGYTVTEVTGRDSKDDPVEVLYITEKRRRVPGLIEMILDLDSKAVCTVSDVKRQVVSGLGAPTRRRILTNSGWRVRGKRK